ncbi:AcrR family transcriptional regulator [Actinoalloteichus hoggarensis]|uniref:Transcriptional regulator BetI n=1 Tax=Actinoalloteichus hoggarensis TaxID=1470176 RepID=A0A221VXS3_9PSEU|nr:TetR/AcrR family transcriptional regulator [Actinoalloteichus hoggarensis]ASO18305.1 transcriptional regulator BetI [Actinoalloteichus hoggarensis]MBB5921667.1 AcrR family transcriptional regulator [Actinoalloteichus hoggarensis]
MSVTRLSRDERRLQLLATAAEIIRTEGTNALSLVRLAERAGVSRPIAYDHFTTREGLLMALYRQYDEQIGRTIRAALPEDAGSVTDVVSVLSAAYVDGVLSAGPECAAVSAALAGSTETRDFHQRSQDFYLAEFRQALEPFVSLSGPRGRALITGVLGVIEGLSRAAVDGRVSRAEAVSASTTIVVGALRQYDEGLAP